MKQTSSPLHLDIQHGDTSFRVAVKRVATARRFTLRVSAATRHATLTMPLRSNFHQAADFAQRHSGWIAARLTRLADEIVIMPGSEIPFRGRLHLIIQSEKKRGTVWIEEHGSAPLLYVAGDPDHAGRRLKDFLKKQARLALDHAVRRYSDQLGLSARGIALKDTKSRWGSCSADGRLNFSWRLIFAPPEILDYLAAHEVAHLKEMNHSRRFWALVRMLYPEYRQAELWLKQNGMTLHRYR